MVSKPMEAIVLLVRIHVAVTYHKCRDGMVPFATHKNHTYLKINDCLLIFSTNNIGLPT